MRAWSREKKLKWVHNRLKQQTGITEFLVQIPENTIEAEGETRLHVDTVPGAETGIVQIRRAVECGTAVGVESKSEGNGPQNEYYNKHNAL